MSHVASPATIRALSRLVDNHPELKQLDHHAVMERDVLQRLILLAGAESPAAADELQTMPKAIDGSMELSQVIASMSQKKKDSMKACRYIF